MATIATNPRDKLHLKLEWLVRCLACPFIGLFYFCNIKNNSIEMVAYWLPADCFGQELNNELLDISYRPFGFHAKEMRPNKIQKEALELCIVKPSILDRLSSLVSGYYILFGIYIGVSKLIFDENPCTYKDSFQDWPFISLLLIWTLPVIYVRTAYGNVVDRMVTDLKIPLDVEKQNTETISEKNKIKVTNYTDTELKEKKIFITITALASVILPWIAVIIAYFTRQIGFS
ncbi:4406_t:CDS:1, partial [Cetraspora pellucida]